VISNESSPSPEPVANPTGAIEQPAVETPAYIDPDNPPWAQPTWMGVLKSLLTWIGSVALLLFVPLVLVIPYLVYLYSTSVGPQPDDLMADKTFLFLSILGVIPAHILTFVVAYVVVTSGGRYSFSKTLGLEWPRSLGSWAGIGLCVVIAGALLGIGAVITKFFGGQKTQLDFLIESSYQARIATVFLAVFTAPLIEEVIYRGILYPAIARVLGAAAGIALVSILFAGVHFYQYKNNLAVVAVITLLSTSLTIVRAVTHRLLPSFVIHLVFNGIQSIIILLQPYFTKAEPITPPPVPAVDLLTLALRHFS
jgi:uncharacterized protein